MFQYALINKESNSLCFILRWSLMTQENNPNGLSSLVFHALVLHAHGSQPSLLHQEGSLAAPKSSQDRRAEGRQGSMHKEKNELLLSIEAACESGRAGRSA
jgi:hypothetical protein